MTHSKGGVNTAFYNYAYDANSRITNVSNKDGTSAYTYDDVDQLTGASYSFQPSESYTYDLNGNRTNAGYQTGLNNRLLSDGTFNYEYDNEGNLIKQTDIVTGEVTQNTWDYRNRLTNVTRNGVAVGTYTYDTYDQRIGKTANGTTERFVYGQNQNIALEFDGSGAQTHRYLHSNGIDQILADEAGGSVGWTLSDNLGTVRDVVDGLGSSQNHIAYNSFGNVTSESNPSFDTRFTFTGRELDAETGNYDYRNRQYNPRSGRFIEEDPLGFAGEDVNLYRYLGNEAVNALDPLGLQHRLNKYREPLRPEDCNFPTVPTSNAASFSGLPPWQPRKDPDKEKQRLDAINLIKEYSRSICIQAKSYRVTPDAIAGAILWEALENPYNVCDFRTNIPGKIHPSQRSPNGEIFQPTAIELVEEEGRVPWTPFGRGPFSGHSREVFLRNPANAITGIAAILDRAAGIYESRANVNIRDQAGVLGALYQGGHPEERVQGLLTRRGENPTANPRIPTRKDEGEALGEWVSRNRSWISKSFFSDCKKC